jgi:hypothetical protein
MTHSVPYARHSRKGSRRQISRIVPQTVQQNGPQTEVIRKKIQTKTRFIYYAAGLWLAEASETEFS